MAVLTAAGTRFGWALKVGGGNFTARIPLDEGAIRITESLGSPAQLEFLIEDTRGTANLHHGAIVTLERLKLTSAGEAQTLFRYFGGHLIETTYTRLPGMSRRMIRCVAVGFESWLDWKYVPNYSSRTDVNGRIRRVWADRAIVQELISKYGAILTAGPYVDLTNTAMNVVSVQGVTLREALERVADVATTVAPEATRDFYVDHYGRLHYYSGNEELEAFFRISDSSYTLRLHSHYGANLVEAWSLSEGGGTHCAGLREYAHGTLSGDFSRNRTTIGIYNEQEHRSTLFGGVNARMTASGANLEPGDTFTLEVWFKRTSNGTMSLFGTGANGYWLGFDSNNKVWAFKLGTGSHFVSDDAVTDFGWHHLVWTRSPGDSDFYLDGEAMTGTTTARTFASAGGNLFIGEAEGAADYFNGYLQYPAVYSAKLTAGQVLNNYQLGTSLAAEGLEVTYTSSDVVHRVYVKGANAQGSGWVQPAGTNFAGYNVDASLDEQDSTTVGKRNAYGRAFIRQHRRIDSIRFSVTHQFSGWALGQLVYITDSALGLDESPNEIRELNTDFNLGNGDITYEMVLGDPRPATFHRGRRRRRRS